MTLRTRLTVAFLAVVLGPVLLSALFVGGSVTAVNEERAADRLELAADAVHVTVASLCRELATYAGTVARLPADDRAAAAAGLVAQGRVDAVEVRAAGNPGVATPAPPPRPWASCTGTGPAGAGRYGAIAGRAPVRDAAGRPVGTAWAAVALDVELLAGLVGVDGVEAVLAPAPPDGGTGGPGVAPEPRPEGTVPTGDGRWTRRLVPTDGQPLPLLLTTSRAAPEGLYALLVIVVVVAGVLAVAAAWWLARSSTRPLTALAGAADRVADGDLSARVPVSGDDEAARVAAAFNRMTQRTQGYVQALTASRDQLRGHLMMLGDALSSTHDLPRILQVILRTAVVTTGARAGAVALVDGRGEVLEGYLAEPAPGRPAGAGPDDGGTGTGDTGPADGDAPSDRTGPADGDAPSDRAGPADGDGGQAPTGGDDHDRSAPFRVPVAASLLGTVVTSGDARRGRADSAPHRHADEPACRSYLAVPISVPDGAATRTPPWPVPRAVRGVLALYDRLGGEDFDDADLAMVRTFAAQAAVAVENVRIHEETQRLSLTDPLTGLWNYRYLQDVLRREVERASRFGRTLTVLALDLDHFKDVNDLYGHPAGDSVLVEFARRISSGIREMDVAFRQGGEEFVVLLPETDTRGGAAVARRLAAAVRDTPMVITPRGSVEERQIRVTVSIGIAVYPDHGRGAQAVRDAADEALYAAKAGGRDTYRTAPSVPDPVVAAELPVRAGTRAPADDLPTAGGSRPAGGEAKPPRQTRGR